MIEKLLAWLARYNPRKPVRPPKPQTGRAFSSAFGKDFG